MIFHVNPLHDLFFHVNPLPRQRIHMKNQVLFSSKDESKTFKRCLLQFLFGTVRINPGIVMLSTFVLATSCGNKTLAGNMHAT